LEQGSIELTIESGGHRVHVGSAHPGQLLGLTSVLTGSPSQNTATAMLPTKLVFVKAQLILEYLKTHPEICLNAVQSLASDIVDLSANTIRSMRFYNRKPHP
jgi:CRP-like cAMP-binding protein